MTRVTDGRSRFVVGLRVSGSIPYIYSARVVDQVTGRDVMSCTHRHGERKSRDLATGKVRSGAAQAQACGEKMLRRVLRRPESQAESPVPSAELQLATLRAAILESRTLILDDERFHCPTVLVHVNAPLALEQQAMEARMAVLNKLGEIVGLQPVARRPPRQLTNFERFRCP